MVDEIDAIRRELDEVRRLRAELERELEQLRRERPYPPGPDLHRPPPHSGPGLPRRRHVPCGSPPVDLKPLTDALEDMMDGISEQVRHSLRDLPGVNWRIYAPRRLHRRREIESITPERIARFISPLGSEERLKIMDFLKDGPKTFNQIEEFTGRTGSSLTHHLNPLLDAGYVVKGEVRGTYHLTVEGRLAYRLAQWLTSRLESETDNDSSNGTVSISFEDETDEGRSSTSEGGDGGGMVSE
ncbi:MAG: ArsR family transcriptional regulator [Candidatus Thorarchaeota archaeon]